MNGLASFAIFVGLFFIGLWVHTLRQWQIGSTLGHDINSALALAIGGINLLTGLCMLFGWG